MDKKYGTKAIAVYDNGLFVETALKLAESFGKVYYYTPWKNGFPKSNPALVGTGFPNIIRINNFMDIIKESDLFYFPDIYDGDMQKFLTDLGYPVFGCHQGEKMELEREWMKEEMRKAGLPVGKYEVITGLDDLRTYLKSVDNQFIKLNCYRGDGETWKHQNYQLSEPMLDEIEWKLGAKKHITKWIVEKALEGKVETGCDSWCINGEFPTKFMNGLEIKDLGYVAVINEEKDMPECILRFNYAMAPLMKQLNFKGWFSTEIRVGPDMEPYMIDFTSRCGSPPSELYQEMYLNMDEIIYEGAHGNCVDPITKDKWGVEALIHSQWADKNWQAIYFPEAIRNHVKLRNVCKIRGNYYVVPSSVGLPEIGAVVATGDTLDNAIRELEFFSKKVTGHFIEVHVDAMDRAEEEMKKLEKMGIKIF